MVVSNKKNTLLKGTAILAGASFVSKFLGFIYKAVLSRLIGAEGLGIYEKAYPIYTMILTISIVGIPVAISKLVAEKRAEGKEDIADFIFQIALKVSFVIGLLAAIIVGVLARPMARYLLDDINVYYSILAIAPAIFLVSIMATYRGYFQGWQQMKPTAVSQMIEQLFRIIIMIILAYLLIPYGVEFGAAGAAAGAFFGAIAGLAILLVIYYRFQANRDLIPESKSIEKPTIKEVLNQIFSLAIPVTLGGLILPLMRLIDASMITRRLEVAGYSLQAATGLYGQFNGMAMTLVRFPTVIAASLAVSLVPAISEAYALDADKLAKRRIAKAFKLTLYVAIPASLGLFILAEPLTEMIFANAEAAIPLRYLSIGVVAIGLQQVTSSILQGFDRPKLPARNLFLGALLNVALNYTLTAMPHLGIRGAAVGTAAGFSLAAGLNIWGVFKIARPSFDYQTLILKPLISGGVMSVFVFVVYEGLLKVGQYKILSTLFSILVGILSYGLVLLLTAAITREDLEVLPRVGIKLINFLDKFGLVRG
ncbi:oligosaccharide flippase family protein [Natroniella sp. ANB-PHB2]|uniref:putative polysaccharide biosynthesis protein n=1 Tax=Natroniella sp. ANB-PHB2 TaxID=3384444 RepID=UPI0038D35FE5